MAVPVADADRRGPDAVLAGGGASAGEPTARPRVHPSDAGRAGVWDLVGPRGESEARGYATTRDRHELSARRARDLPAPPDVRRRRPSGPASTRRAVPRAGRPPDRAPGRRADLLRQAARGSPRRIASRSR